MHTQLSCRIKEGEHNWETCMLLIHRLSSGWKKWHCIHVKMKLFFNWCYYKLTGYSFQTQSCLNNHNRASMVYSGCLLLRYIFSLHQSHVDMWNISYNSFRSSDGFLDSHRLPPTEKKKKKKIDKKNKTCYHLYHLSLLLWIHLYNLSPTSNRKIIKETNFICHL